MLRRRFGWQRPVLSSNKALHPLDGFLSAPVSSAASRAGARPAEIAPTSLNALALEALKALPRGIEPKAPVFLTLARDGRDALVRRFSRALLTTGINLDAPPAQRVSWHTLRHTFASRLVQAGVNLLTVKELLGHSSLVMVMRYAHLADDNLKAAVDTLAAVPNLHKTCTATGGGSEGDAP